MRPAACGWIAGSLVYTISRGLMVINLPTLKMFGGPNPDGWLTPWGVDTVLGILTPFVIFATLKLQGPKTWGLLLAFNCVGATDYAEGLLAQYQHPAVTMWAHTASKHCPSKQCGHSASYCTGDAKS